MAHLGSTTTDGQLAFKKYVTENKRYKEITYEIERGMASHIFKHKGDQITPGNREYKSGTKLHVTSSALVTIGKNKYTHVKIGNEVGLMPINKIRKPTAGNGTHYEVAVVQAINGYILAAGGVIDVRLRGDNKTYKGIQYAVQVNASMNDHSMVLGDPKADIILCRDIKNPTGEGSIYISHKSGTNAKGFQQYSGISENAGARIYKNALVQKFMAEVVAALGGGDKLPAPMLGLFTNDVLSNLAIYGPGYGGRFSVNHCQVIGQGHPVFREMPQYVEMSFDSHMGLSGDLSRFGGEYSPSFGATYRIDTGYTTALGATYRNARGFDFNGKRYHGARLGIYPKGLLDYRSGIVIVKIK